MRLMVLGHSDSAGEALPPGLTPWPQRLAARIPAELVHVKFTAFGPRAIDFATRKLSEASPDVVIISLSAYPCAVSSVSLSVRRRFGERTEHWYKRIERAFDRRTFERPGLSGVSNSLARRISRRFLGATPLATVDEVFEIYDAILRHAAQMEGLQVVAMGETHFSALMQKYDPVLVPSVVDLKRRLRVVADRYHFAWLDTEPLLAATGNREAIFAPDGVHNSPLGHDLYLEWIHAALVEHGFVTPARQ